MMRRLPSFVIGIISKFARKTKISVRFRDALTRIGYPPYSGSRRRPVYLTARYFEKTLPLWREALEEDFLRARKTSRQHEFTSIEVERYVGGGLNQHIETARVKLTDPDITVNQIENDRLLLVKGATKASVVSRSARRKMCCR
jgi:adenylyl- and sulfurtransferase ThiI